MHGLGRVFNVIFAASGLDIPMTQATAVTFVHSQGGTGTATLTLTQTDSRAVLPEIDLPAPANDDVYYIGPDVGGTWTFKARTSANVYTLGGATNDTGVMTVHASQLTNGYDQIQGTASAGSLVAIIHDLLVQRKPSNLRSSLLA